MFVGIDAARISDAPAHFRSTLTSHSAVTLDLARMGNDIIRNEVAKRGKPLS